MFKKHQYWKNDSSRAKLFKKNVKVTRKGKNVTVKADDAKGNELVLDGDYCLVAVGRRPYTDGLNVDHFI